MRLFIPLTSPHNHRTMFTLSTPLLLPVQCQPRSSRPDRCRTISVRCLLNEARLVKAEARLDSFDSSIKGLRSTDNALLQVVEKRGRHYEDTFQTQLAQFKQEFEPLRGQFKQELEPLRRDISSIKEDNKLIRDDKKLLRYVAGCWIQTARLFV